MALLTIAEAADLVARPENTIRNWVRQGWLKPIRANAKPLMFHHADVVDCAYRMTSRARHTLLDRIWQDVVAESSQDH